MINIRSPLIVLTAATMLLVSACETIQKEAKSLGKLLESTVQSTTPEKGPALEQFKSDGFNFNFASIISDRKKSLSLARNQGRGLVHSPALLTYVNYVLAKLTKVAPETGVPARAYIADSHSIYARAAPSGEIFLTLNLLNHLKTEDGLAFVLAHELSHIIYRHHEADYLKKTQSRALKGFDLGYDLLKSRPKTKSAKGRFPMSEYMLVGEASLLVNQDFVAPTWTRDQEDAADMLGLDMVAKAGYSLKPIFALFNKLASAQMELIEIKATPKQRFAQHMAVELKSPRLKSYFTTAIAEFSSFFDRTFKRTPRTPKEREEFLFKYSKINPTPSKPTTSVLWNIETPRKGRKFKNRKSVLTLFHHYDSADKAMAALKDTKIKEAVTYARIAVSG